ncbi:MAG: hypothetical protein ACRERD_31095, partial [Candidatus Binatia bacterium]
MSIALLPRTFVLDANLANEPVLPEQFFSACHHETGEQALWRAVVWNAWECLTARSSSLPGNALRLRAEARDWFLSDDQRCGSFAWCCAVLGLPCEEIQQCVRTWIAGRASPLRRAICWRRGYCRRG